MAEIIKTWQLKPEDAVRIDLISRPRKGTRLAHRERMFVFHCRECGAEFKRRHSEIKLSPGTCRRCGHLRSGAAASIRNRKRPYEALYNRFVYNRPRKATVLSYEEFLAFTMVSQCHYCDDQIVWPERNLLRYGGQYNLDRKDNSKGYESENLVVCCWPCNQLKGARLTYEEMVAVMKELKAIRRATGKTKTWT